MKLISTVFLSILLSSTTMASMNFKCNFWEQDEKVQTYSFEGNESQIKIPLKDGIHEIVLTRSSAWGISVGYRFFNDRSFILTTKSTEQISFKMEEPQMSVSCYPL